MERRLTPKGEKQAARMADFLRTRLPKHTRILVSPAMRTQQTALALTKDFTTEPAIAPNASPQTLLKAVDTIEDDACVLLVGHQPTLGETAALLMTGKPDYWSIKKGAVWWLSQRERNTNSETILRLVIAPDSL